jgi:hypothetical protein
MVAEGSCSARLGTPTASRNGPMDSHAEVRVIDRRNGFRWSAHLDSRRGLPSKNVEQEFARRTTESDGRFAWPSHHQVGGASPLNFEPATVQPPTQVVASTANVPPQGSIHCRRQATGSSSVGPPDVLVVNKELVEISEGPHPPDAEEADGRAGPDPRYEPSEVLPLGKSDPASFGEPLEVSRENEARASNEIAFSQYDVGCEIMSSPAFEQCWNRGAELIEEITELKALLRV